MKTKLDFDTIIILCNEEKKCKYCNKELVNINVELLYEGYNSSKWQKEGMYYCDSCNKYFFPQSKISDFNKKYPGYLVEHNDYVEEKMSEFTCYILAKKAKHSSCNGMPTDNKIIERYYILENENGTHHKVKLNRCSICNNFLILQEEYLNIRNYAIKIHCKPAKLIESKLLSKYKIPNIDGIPLLLSSNDILSFDIEGCQNKNHDILKMTFNLRFYVNSDSLVTKSIQGAYCKNCNKYITDRQLYDTISNDRMPDCKLEQQISKKNVFKEVNIDGKADFIVRTNLIKCSNKNHIIEDIKAKITIVDKDGKYSEKLINAYYCRNCNLYYIYNRDYNRLIQEGMPLCQIYEYEKYITENTQNIYNLNQESILHAYGYNVNSSKEITENQRRKILEFIIEKNILSKHKIISYITYFINMHKSKSNKSYESAINKWESDILYLNNTESGKNYIVNSIKTIKYKEKNHD